MTAGVRWTVVSAKAVAFAIAALACAGNAAAQDPSPAPSRAALVEKAQSDKAVALSSYQPDRVEKALDRVEKILRKGVRFHPFFDSAYSGGGFTLGAGYVSHLGEYNTLDFRGSITFSGYKRIETEFLAPRLFDRRGRLSLLGGWREATAVAFYGLGTENTSKDDRVNYAFDQPYGSAVLDLWPTRKYLLLRGAMDLSTWNTAAGTKGPEPPIDEVYSPDTLPGLGASPTYLHTEATIGIDTRSSPGYTRRGSYLGFSYHDFHDANDQFGFHRTDYEATHHVPILKEAWVVSLHARAQLASSADGQVVPYFMLPDLGGGSTLRGFSSWRFRDLNSLLLQAEWRIIASRILDMALFYDAGRVTSRRSDLFDGHLKSDYGVGFRIHGRLATPLRVEIAHGNEGLGLVFSARAPF